MLRKFWMVHREMRARLVQDYMLNEVEAERVLEACDAEGRSWIAAIAVVTGEGRAEVLARFGRGMIHRYRKRHPARTTGMDDNAILAMLACVDGKPPPTRTAVNGGPRSSPTGIP